MDKNYLLKIDILLISIWVMQVLRCDDENELDWYASI